MTIVNHIMSRERDHDLDEQQDLVRRSFDLLNFILDILMSTKFVVDLETRKESENVQAHVIYFVNRIL